MPKPPPPPLEKIDSHHILVRRQFTPSKVVPVPRPTAFYHSGDSGDIIYALLWVRHIGGGQFYLGPDTKWETNSKHKPSIYKWLLPLLLMQPYIKRADYAAKKPDFITHDLNVFRDIWMDLGAKATHRVTRLFEAYPKRFADPVKLPENEAWIQVDAVDLHKYPVVIHRSPRYQNQEFPWIEVVRRYSGKMLFVGLKEEYDAWVNQYGPAAEYRPVDNALDMARVIAGCKLFIGNQSCPMAIALALNKPVIQETCPATPDCVFDRPNAQYCTKGEIRWPKFGRRYVVPLADKHGFYELGPCENAHGMGDALTITPLIRALKGKAIMCMPPSMAKLAPLFTDICPVRFTGDYPVFKHYSAGGAWHMAEYKLRMFGLWPSDPLPVVHITEEEKAWAKTQLQFANPPIAFVPTCSVEWGHVRQVPPEYWEPIIDALSLKFTVLQFGLKSFPLVGPIVGGARDFRNYSIREAAALYSQIGRYIGVDTGDYHLMLAVGGETITLIPHEQKTYRPKEWCYKSERAQYFFFEDREEIDNAIERLLE